MLEPIVLLFFHAVLYGGSWIVGLGVFHPLYERTLLFRPSAKFRISDLMVLAFHVQVAVAVAMGLGGPWDEIVWTLSAEFVGLGTFLWFNGLRMLGRGGVDKTAHRWVFLGLVLPVGYASGATVVFSVFALPFTLSASIIEQDPWAILGSGIMLSSWPTVYLVNRAARRLAVAARRSRAENDGIQFASDVAVLAASSPREPRRRHRDGDPDAGVFFKTANDGVQVDASIDYLD
jgi:hypothetical protein